MHLALSAQHTTPHYNERHTKKALIIIIILHFYVWRVKNKFHFSNASFCSVVHKTTINAAHHDGRHEAVRILNAEILKMNK